MDLVAHWSVSTCYAQQLTGVKTATSRLEIMHTLFRSPYVGIGSLVFTGYTDTATEGTFVDDDENAMQLQLWTCSSVDGLTAGEDVMSVYRDSDGWYLTDEPDTKPMYCVCQGVVSVRFDSEVGMHTL